MVIEHADEKYSSKIRDYLVHRAHAVRVDADRNQLNLAGLSEDFYADFLNILLDLRLENANTSERNAAGIDLIDWKNRVAAQVSVTCAPDTIRRKIQHSIDRFDKPEGVWQFYFVPITNEAPGLGKEFRVPDGLRFDQSKDVLDIARLMELARGIYKLEKLVGLVDRYSKDESDYQELRKTLDHLLLQTWKEHRSFKLMQTDEIDKRLFPGVQDSHQFEALGKKNDDDAESPVWSIIRDSWREPKNHPVMIEGKGGIGKTVTLFSLTNIKHDLIPAPAVYVPMFDLINSSGNVINLTDYFQSSVSFASLHPEQRRGICSLAAEEWNHGPKLLVLLDGFNEVPGPRRWDVLQMLRKWHMVNQGAQLIAVSRPMDNLSLENAFGDETIAVTLCELTKETVSAYLKSLQGEDIRLPEPNDPIWKTIVYPLFLNLYIKADCLRNQRAWKGYPLDIRDAAGPGSIIWNYLQRELLRQENDMWILRCAIANEYLAPFLAYHMVQHHDYTISQREAIAIIQKSVSEMDMSRMPTHLSNLISWWESQEMSIDPPLFLKSLNWPDIVLRESGLLVQGQSKLAGESGNKIEQRFEFLHQNFRDCLAAILLINQADVATDNEFPDTWQDYQLNQTLNYVAELIDSKTVEKIWETNRLSQTSNQKRKHKHIATCNLLEVYKRNNSLTKTINCAGMDLRGLSLTRYLGEQGSILPLFRYERESNGTLLDRKSFQSNGHTGYINCVAVLSDGQVISGSYDSTLRVWDVATGQCLQTLEGHTDAIRCVAELSVGKMVSGSSDRSLRVWDANTGKCLQILQGHKGSVYCVAVLADGRIVSGSEDRTLRMWDVATGQCLQTLEGHTDTIRCVAVLDDGRVVSGSKDGTLRIWDTATGKTLKTMKGHIGSVYCVAVLPDKRVVSGSEDRFLRLWDADTGQCLQTLVGHKGPVYCVAVLPDKRVVSGSYDSVLQIWDIGTGQRLQTLVGQRGSITRVAVLPDGRLISGTRDSILRVWDTATGYTLQTLKGIRRSINCIAVLAGERVVNGSFDCTLRIWDANTGQTLQTLDGHRGYINCVVGLPDGRVVSGSSDRTIRVWDSSTGKCLQIFEGHRGYINCVTALPRGRIVSGSSDCTLQVWDIFKCQSIKILEGHRDWIRCVAVLPDGRVVSGSDDETIIMWDVTTGQKLQTLVGHSGAVYCVAVLPDGRIVSGSSDCTLQVWDGITGERLQSLVGHRDRIRCVAVLADGKVVSGSDDSTLRIWDASTGKCLQILEGHSNLVSCVTNLPDGRILSGSYDSSIRMWSATKGNCLDILENTEVDVSQMVFSQAILTSDLAIMLWRNGAVISSADYEKYVRFSVGKNSKPPKKGQIDKPSANANG